MQPNKQNNHRVLPMRSDICPSILRLYNASPYEKASSMEDAHAKQSQTVINECGIFISHFPGIVKSGGELPPMKLLQRLLICPRGGGVA